MILVFCGAKQGIRGRENDPALGARAWSRVLLASGQTHRNLGNGGAWLIRERGWQYPQSLKQSCVPLGPRLALRDHSLCPFCPGNPAYWRQKIRGTSPHDGKSHGHPLWQGWDPVTRCLSWALPVPSDGVSRAHPTLEQSRQVLNT